jgi:hypothetical protein
MLTGTSANCYDPSVERCEVGGVGFADPEPRFVPDLGSDAPQDGLMTDVQFYEQAKKQVEHAREMLTHRLQILVGPGVTCYCQPGLQVAPGSIVCAVLLAVDIPGDECQWEGEGRTWEAAFDQAHERMRLSMTKRKPERAA